VNILRRSTVPLLLAAAAVPAWTGLSAQVQDPNAITVTGQLPTDLKGLPKGPEVQGIISARKGAQMQVTDRRRQQRGDPRLPGHRHPVQRGLPRPR
jgi:hypothetical protein